MIYVVIRNLLQALDNSRLLVRPIPSQTLDPLTKQLGLAETYYAYVQSRNARLSYLLGLLTSVLILGVMGGLAYWLGAAHAEWPLSRFVVSAAPALLCMVGGAVGATVSIIWRMAGGTLVLPQEEPPLLLGLFGSFRPFIGAAFGLVLYGLLVSGILPIKSPTNEENIYFYLVISVIAGFSERLAPDLIERTAGAMGRAAAEPAQK